MTSAIAGDLAVRARQESAESVEALEGAAPIPGDHKTMAKIIRETLIEPHATNAS